MILRVILKLIIEIYMKKIKKNVNKIVWGFCFLWLIFMKFMMIFMNFIVDFYEFCLNDFYEKIMIFTNPGNKL